MKSEEEIKERLEQYKHALHQVFYKDSIETGIKVLEWVLEDGKDENSEHI
jgi:hypothetical protein